MSDCRFMRGLHESPGEWLRDCRFIKRKLPRRRVGWLRDCRFKRLLRADPGGMVEGLQTGLCESAGGNGCQ